MYFQPVSLILGSDDKPAKLRLVGDNKINHDYEIRTCWLTDTDAALYLSDNQTKRIMEKDGDKWIFHSYNRLPLLDMYENVVDDGIVMRGLDAMFFSRSIVDNVSKTFESIFFACDAHGNVGEYSTKELLTAAYNDKTKRFFCNLDYDYLYRRNNLNAQGFGSNAKNVLFELSDISSDVGNSLLQMTEHNIRLDCGNTLLPDSVFQQAQVMLPAMWTSVYIDNLKSKVLRDLVFPKRMKQLTLQAAGCKNLERIVLPEEVDTSLTIWLRNCETVREIVLPKCVGKELKLELEHLPSIRQVSQLKSREISGKISIAAIDCPLLSTLDTPCYSYQKYESRNTPIATIACTALYCYPSNIDSSPRSPRIFYRGRD